MPTIAAQYDPKVGPFLQVMILSGDMARQAATGALSSMPASTPYNALLDTGADSTCISPKVVTDVGLSPLGKLLMGGSTGSSPTNYYEFAVGLQIGVIATPTGHPQADFQFQMIEQGAEWPGNPERSCEVLLGRDILCRGIFSLSFDGHLILSF